MRGAEVQTKDYCAAASTDLVMILVKITTLYCVSNQAVMNNYLTIENVIVFVC